MKKGKKQSKNSFTLVEIMIVIAILALLVSIGVPGYLATRNKSSLKVEMANMKQVRNAVTMYDLNETTDWNTDLSLAAAFENISYLWPSTSTSVDPSSYINRQMFCAWKGGGEYGYVYPTNKCECSVHGTEEQVVAFFE